MLKPILLFLLLVHRVLIPPPTVLLHETDFRTDLKTPMYSKHWFHCNASIPYPIWFKSHTPVVFIHTVFYFSLIRTLSYLMHRINGEHIQFFSLLMKASQDLTFWSNNDNKRRRNISVQQAQSSQRPLNWDVGNRSSLKLWYWQVQFYTSAQHSGRIVDGIEKEESYRKSFSTPLTELNDRVLGRAQGVISS